jgi:hypothetical protein
VTTQQNAELFGTYVEVVLQDGDHRRRRQWVILPQMPARLAPGDSPITSHLVWFEREQRNATHRAIWHYHKDTDSQFKRELGRHLQRYERAAWEVSPLITCEIHPTELAQILKERKTPYRILQRLQKVARSMYRLDIS